MKFNTIHMMILIGAAFPTAALAVPCADSSECSPGESCQSGECVSESGAPLFECETTADCGSFEECQDGMCVPAAVEPDKPEGSCTGDSDCGSGEVCVSGYCADEGEYCKSASDCGQFEKCEFSVPGSSESGDDVEWGYCTLDATQIPVDATCSEVCQIVSNCPTLYGSGTDSGSGSSSDSAGESDQKADEAGDKAEFLEDCTLSCSYFIATNQAVAEFQSAASCIQQNAASCEAMENNCMDEIDAVDDRIDSLAEKSAGSDDDNNGTGGQGSGGQDLGTPGGGTDDRGGCASFAPSSNPWPWLLVAVFGLWAFRRKNAVGIR